MISPYAEIVHGGSTLNWAARREVYRDCTHPPLEEAIYGAVTRELDIQPTDCVLDVGCAGGEDLLRWRREFPYTRLVGVDIDETLFFATQTAVVEEGLFPIVFHEGTAEELPYGDNTFDKASAFYVLYYFDDPTLALQELRRVVRPGGTVAIVTSAPNNKPWHRELEQRIAMHLMAMDLTTTWPRVPAATFTSETASAVLPKFFRVDKAQSVKANIRVRTPGEVEKYLTSLWTMRTVRSKPYPSPAAWEEALEVVARPVLEEAIDRHGEFVDFAHHAYFVCRNTKAS